MKRLVSNKSWKEIYGQKWQNIESSMESESNDDDLHSSPVESIVTPQIFDIEAARQEPSTSTTGHGDEENKIPKEKRVGGRTEGESMYRAALVGDWEDAEKLLGRDPKLAFDYVTEEGDRALHVAAAMKHKDFVQKLIKRMSDNDLMLLDGRGYTACCYAAISGVVEIARFFIEKNRNLVTAHDEEKKTPLHKAAFRGNKKMLSYLLESTQVEDLSKKEWFDLLLVTIRGEMHDVAIKVLEKNGSIATMVNEEGTALHLLGLQEIPNARNNSILMEIILDSIDEGMEMEAPELSELAEKLWAEMQNLEKGSLLELIRKPLLLHDAAKAGHVELVTMLTRTYPQLIWDTDSNGYTLFHLAVIYRQVHVFNLIHQVDAMIGFRTIIWQDQDGNNILHLAAKLGPPNKTKLSPALQIQRELLWFEAVGKIVPHSCARMKNKKGQTPRELFSKEHSRLLKEGEMWMRNTADSFMLIATILLTVVFTAAFTVPGGYGGQTGEPVLAKTHWFKVFLVFEVLSLIGSVVSILMFRSIMASSFAEHDFLSKLPTLQMLGFLALLLSLVGAFSAFMSSISLFHLKNNGLVWFGFCTLYGFGSFWLFAELSALSRDYKLRNSIRSSTRHALFDSSPKRNNNRFDIVIITELHRLLRRLERH